MIHRPDNLGLRSRRGSRGMSLLELILGLGAVSAVIGALVVVSNSVRADSADQQTRTVLRTLRTALNRYHAAHHAYPPGPTGMAINRLQNDRSSEDLLRNLTVVADTDGTAAIYDGYGHAIRYLDPTEPTPRAPDFVSAGPDGKFGDMDIPRSSKPASPRGHLEAQDNRYGSDYELPSGP